jgi:hypothetical protein
MVYRQQVATFHIFSYTDLQARARRLVSQQRCESYMDQAWRRSRLIVACSRRRGVAPDTKHRILTDPLIHPSQQPQTRIQHCLLKLPPRNHPLRRRKLRPRSSPRPPQRSRSNPTSRPSRQTALQSRRDKRSRPSHPRCTSRAQKNDGEIQPESETDFVGEQYEQYYCSYPKSVFAGQGGGADGGGDRGRAGEGGQEGGVQRK